MFIEPNFFHQSSETLLVLKTGTITDVFVSGIELTACLIHRCDLFSPVTESFPLPLHRAVQPFPPSPALQLGACVRVMQDTSAKEPETLNPAGCRVTTQNRALNFSPGIALPLFFFPCIYLDTGKVESRKSKSPTFFFRDREGKHYTFVSTGKEWWKVDQKGGWIFVVMGIILYVLSDVAYFCMLYSHIGQVLESSH